MNRSVQRISEMYQDLDRRLKRTSEKELFQKMMASNEQEREDTQENIHLTLEQY